MVGAFAGASLRCWNHHKPAIPANNSPSAVNIQTSHCGLPVCSTRLGMGAATDGSGVGSGGMLLVVGMAVGMAEGVAVGVRAGAGIAGSGGDEAFWRVCGKRAGCETRLDCDGGAVVSLVGVGVGTGSVLVGEAGVGVSVGIALGTTGIPASTSTGPWTCGVGVGVGAGGSWKSRTEPGLAATGAASMRVIREAAVRAVMVSGDVEAKAGLNRL